MANDPNSFVGKYGTRTLSYVIGIGFAVLLVLLALGSCATSVENTDVGIVVNNITGTITLYENGGMVLHLPFGLSSVYRVPKQQFSLRLARDVTTQEHPQGDQVKIKTNDGSNVEADVEVVYQIDVKDAFKAYRELVENTATSSFNGRNVDTVGHDAANNLEAILRAVTRSEVRNQLGELTTLYISDPKYRTEKLHSIQKNLADYFASMGVEIVSVNAQNFHFNEEYEQIVRQRKSAEQIRINQNTYQDTKLKTRERMVAEANKERETSLAQLKGEMNRRMLTAQGEAKRILTKAQQESYQMDREGEIALASAQQEAAAIEAEGQQKAQAVGKLFEAYETGGEGLVREALTKLYDGVTVSARPYAPSDRIDQVRAVPMQILQDAPARPPAPQAPATGRAGTIKGAESHGR
jgi:regulator of protease activity HflC (stomatin/prohibitin superfamily)